MKFSIDKAESLNVTDSELSDLLTRVYIGEGYTDAKRGKKVFSPSSVRSRGQLICARPQESEILAGMVIVVFPDSPSRRMAALDETEMHLLAVAKKYRGFGLGRSLVTAAIEATKNRNFHKMVLWTQPSMTTAHRLYESSGFKRVPLRDPIFYGQQYLAYERRW